ncbi:MAG: histidinol dehydrogenase, partial [bacterium]|nr:histidinol dehydrogenase [bacterium]
MQKIKLTAQTQQDILNNLLKRNPGSYGQYEAVVAEIIAKVRGSGDQAVFDYTSQFDKWNVTAENVRVTKAEIDEAVSAIDTDFLRVMEKSAENITDFHRKQLRNSWIDTKADGSILGQRILPIASSGIYVPGGKAAYPSSLLMNALPAKVAGVKKIVMTTPANAEGKVNPGTLAAAKIAGVDEIYKVGGAQAIAAMAFGTKSIPKVDKITGPGNIFVALAKKACFGYVS